MTVANNCAGLSNVLNEDTEDYYDGWLTDNSSQPRFEFRYHSADELSSLPIVGELDAYGGGGYVFPLSHPLRTRLEELQMEMDRLKQSNWIDKGTRVLFIEFAVSNVQVNLFATVTIIAEFMPGGGVVPNERIDVFRLQRYHSGFGMFIMACEIVFMIFVIYYTFHELRMGFKLKRDYFRKAMNVISMSLVIIAWAAFALFIQREILTQGIIDTFVKTKGTGYIRLQYVAAVDEVLGYLVAFLVFLGNLKFLNLLRFNKRLGMLLTTLMECASELSGFAFCLLVVFMAFVQLFYLILGLTMADFSTFINSIEACFSMMLGKFNFHQISINSPFLGPAAFFIFGLATSLILINILLTIVIRTFEEVKKDASRMPNDYEMVEFILNRIRAVVNIQRKHKVAPEEPCEKTASTNVDDLPEKLDKLIECINNTYFDKGQDVNGLMNKGKQKERPAAENSDFQ